MCWLLTGNCNRWVEFIFEYQTDFIAEIWISLICFLRYSEDIASQPFVKDYEKRLSSNCSPWVNRIKHFGKRMHVSPDPYNQLHCLSVTPQKQDTKNPPKTRTLHLVPGLVCHWDTLSLPHHFQINSLSKQRKYCSRSPPSPHHTHSRTHLEPMKLCPRCF